MKRKALVLGATPIPGYEGPWVEISDAERWIVEVKRIGLLLEVQSDSLLSIPIDGEPIEFSGKLARICVTDEIRGKRSVSVIARAIYGVS